MFSVQVGDEGWITGSVGVSMGLTGKGNREIMSWRNNGIGGGATGAAPCMCRRWLRFGKRKRLEGGRYADPNGGAARWARTTTTRNAGSRQQEGDAIEGKMEN